MDNWQILKECAENLALLTQLGLSLASPPVVCLYAALWLQRRYALGGWIMVVALLLGIGGGVMSAYKFWTGMKKRWERKDSKKSSSEGSENTGGEEHKD